MKETYKEGLMLLAGLVMGLALGGLIVFIWLSDASTRMVQTNTVAINSSTSNTTSEVTTVAFEQFDFTAEIPTNWKIDRKVYEIDQIGTNSELAVSGPEGSVRFIFNGDGFGGGPCAGVDNDVDLSKEVDVTTKEGILTTCHHKDDGTESWSTGGNMARTDAHYINMKDGKMFVVLATAKAPVEKNRSIVLGVIQSLDFK